MQEMSIKLNEIANKMEPVVAFRGEGVKDSGSANEQYVRKHGEFEQNSYSNLYGIKLLVIWQNIGYNIGDGYDSSNGKFTAPVDGIYFFHSHARTYGSSRAYIRFVVDNIYKTYSNREEDDGHDTLTATEQFILNKGDTVYVYFYGKFWNPAHRDHAYFEGHLIRQINN